MKRAIPIILAAAVIGAAFWLWTVLFPSPEKVIQSRLNALAKDISFSSSGGALGRAYDAQRAANFFTTNVDVELNVSGYDSISLHGRDEVLQVALAARSRLTSLKVEFPDMNITIDPGGETAKVNLTAKAVVPGERDISAQEFDFMLKKVDGKWLIYKVETVKTLSDAGVTPLKTESAPVPPGLGKANDESRSC
ncbi:MAG TPA: hypothetical protein VG938_01730 [Verrucomicrobiae bacterium]|jgi:hypothetical protein|nr:hypothetical protein [Verrucomicrobiae bacterium]